MALFLEGTYGVQSWAITCHIFLSTTQEVFLRTLSSFPLFSAILLLSYHIHLSLPNSSNMAPDISQMSLYTSGTAEPQDGYKVQDITFRDPKNRRLKVLTIGAGVSGIMMAYKIQKDCEKYASVIAVFHPLVCW